MRIPRIQVNIGMPHSYSGCNDTFKLFENMVRLCNTYGVNIVCDMTPHLEHKNERAKIIRAAGIAWCGVPIYEYYLRYGKKNNYEIKIEPFLKIVDRELEMGAQYILLHPAFNKRVFDHLERSQRYMKIASRGGGILWRHFYSTAKENPLYKHFDLILDHLRASNTTLFLGMATRPGTICDGLDETVIQEMHVQSELVREAKLKGVEVIVEGVGHTTISDLIKWVKLSRSIFGAVPLKPLPIPTDIGAGLDNVGHAISVYICTKMGVEYICCMSPAEHLGSPSLEDIQIGISSVKLAIHIAMLHESPEAMNADLAVSLARAKNDWGTLFTELIDPHLARKKFCQLNKDSSLQSCTMCNELCPKLVMELKDEGGINRGCTTVSN